LPYGILSPSSEGLFFTPAVAGFAVAADCLICQVILFMTDSLQSKLHSPSPVRLVTRGSPLALRQAELTKARIEVVFPGARVEIIVRKTSGDRQKDWVLREKGGRGLFTLELEEALLAGEADLAVHSAKDLPTLMPDGLEIATFLPRAPAHDVLILRKGCEAPSRLATGSPRRQAQAALLFPGAEWTEIRGNVQTRLEKIARGEADGTLLAAAGLERLGISEWPGLVFRPLTLTEMVPAVGQGAIALQCRKEERSRWAALGDEVTSRAVTLERLFLRAMGGGCHVAFAGHAAGDQFHAFHPQLGRETIFLPNGDFDAATRAVLSKLAAWFPSI
jgi:hydroxymethylbilane synthase